MSSFEIYVFILCLVVFALLTGLSVAFLTIVLKQGIKLIRCGAEDDKLIQEYNKAQAKKTNNICKGIENTVSLLLCLLVCAFFAFSLCVNIKENKFSENVPTLQVVQSGSMSTKHDKNTYLLQNDLNDQIQTFDLIFAYKAPDEFELKLYDVVVYEVDDVFLVHRIVGIEEPNSSHPDERYFLCQGDANERPDRFPVKYEQIKGIYRGERVPFVGSFILFMQSPAGWLCMFLIVVAIIATPILEKKIKKEKDTRLKILGVITKPVIEETVELNETLEQEPKPELENYAQVEEEILATCDEDIKEDIQPEKAEILLKDINECRTFREKLDNSIDAVKNRHNFVLSYISRVEGISGIETADHQTFVHGERSVCRMLFRGKTLCILLALEPSDYEGTKYLFTNITRSKVHSDFHMRLKLSSDRQAKWTCELLSDMFARLKFTLLDNPRQIPFTLEKIEEIQEQTIEEKIEEIAEEKLELENNNPFAHLKGLRDSRTFKERLEQSSEQVKSRYETVTELLRRVDGVRIIDAKKTETFKKGNTPITKLTIKGKTLNAYLGLQPNDYVDSKYIFSDESNVRAHASYPMRVKVTSDRQARWVNELITEIANKNSLTILEKPVIKVAKEFSFADLKKKKIKGFKYRLRTLPVARERFDKIKEELSKIEGVRKIDSKSSVTYKLKSTPIVKFTIRGKTLNAYLGLNPNEYLGTKYIFTDVSNVKAYANYPMRVKVTSDRQVKWINELINLIIGGVK